MKIAIIGAGAVGTALAKGWSRQGHEIIFGVRTPAKPEIKALLDLIPATATDPSTAAELGDVIVIALPWAAVEEVTKSLPPLGGKTIIDCTNPLVMTETGLGLDRGFETSGGEHLASWLPTGNVVKTLNQVGAESMADADSFSQSPVMFMAGDSDAAKDQAADLVSSLGFEMLDAGGLHKSRLLEPYAMVWINQALLRGYGRDWAFGALHKP